MLGSVVEKRLQYDDDYFDDDLSSTVSSDILLQQLY